jgi:hypothetical protein
MVHAFLHTKSLFFIEVYVSNNFILFFGPDVLLQHSRGTSIDVLSCFIETNSLFHDGLCSTGPSPSMSWAEAGEAQLREPFFSFLIFSGNQWSHKIHRKSGKKTQKNTKPLHSSRLDLRNEHIKHYALVGVICCNCKYMFLCVYFYRACLCNTNAMKF